mgnify:CR=1 FL=1
MQNTKVKYTNLRSGERLRGLKSPIKKTSRATERDRADVIEKKEKFLDEIKDIPVENLVFLDEAGSHLNMTRTHARAPVGERAVCKHSAKRYSNISIVGAISLVGFKHFYPFDGSVDEERFLMFLDELLPKLSLESVLVMDNVRFHHCDSVKEKIEASGKRVIYLPPYHPDLNPIEEGWSCVKRTLRSLKTRTIPDYLDALKSACQNVTASMAGGFFRHSGYSVQSA